MSVIIRLQGLSWSASAMDIRHFFNGLNIPPGGVHIIGGEKGDAFIAFSSDEDARLAMLLNNGILNECPVQLFLSSKTEMQNTITQAKQTPITKPPPASMPNQASQPSYPTMETRPNEFQRFYPSESFQSIAPIGDQRQTFQQSDQFGYGGNQQQTFRGEIMEPGPTPANAGDRPGVDSYANPYEQMPGLDKLKLPPALQALVAPKDLNSGAQSRVSDSLGKNYRDPRLQRGPSAETSQASSVRPDQVSSSLDQQSMHGRHEGSPFNVPATAQSNFGDIQGQRSNQSQPSMTPVSQGQAPDNRFGYGGFNKPDNGNGSQFSDPSRLDSRHSDNSSWRNEYGRDQPGTFRQDRPDMFGRGDLAQRNFTDSAGDRLDSSLDKPNQMRPNLSGSMILDMPGSLHPDMPGDMRSDMPESMHSNMPGNMRPELAESKKPEMPGNARPDMPGNMRPDMPGNMRPDMPGIMRPDMPGNMRPDMPGEMRPDMPGYFRSDMPGNFRSDMPGHFRSDMPGNIRTDMPGNMRPDMQGNMRPDMPGNLGLSMPGNMGPNMPGNIRPDMSGNIRPDMPGNMRPDMPGNMRPDMPGNMRPDMPGDRRPDMPGNFRSDMPGNMRPDNPGSVIPDNIPKNIGPDKQGNMRQDMPPFNRRGDPTGPPFGREDTTYDRRNDLNMRGSHERSPFGERPDRPPYADRRDGPLLDRPGMPGDRYDGPKPPFGRDGQERQDSRPFQRDGPFDERFDGSFHGHPDEQPPFDDQNMPFKRRREEGRFDKKFGQPDRSVPGDRFDRPPFPGGDRDSRPPGQREQPFPGRSDGPPQFGREGGVPFPGSRDNMPPRSNQGGGPNSAPGIPTIPTSVPAAPVSMRQPFPPRDQLRPDSKPFQEMRPDNRGRMGPSNNRDTGLKPDKSKDDSEKAKASNSSKGDSRDRDIDKSDRDRSRNRDRDRGRGRSRDRERSRDRGRDRRGRDRSQDRSRDDDRRGSRRDRDDYRRDRDRDRKRDTDDSRRDRRRDSDRSPRSGRRTPSPDKSKFTPSNASPAKPQGELNKGSSVNVSTKATVPSTTVNISKPITTNAGKTNASTVSSLTTKASTLTSTASTLTSTASTLTSTAKTTSKPKTGTVSQPTSKFSAGTKGILGDSPATTQGNNDKRGPNQLETRNINLPRGSVNEQNGGQNNMNNDSQVGPQQFNPRGMPRPPAFQQDMGGPNPFDNRGSQEPPRFEQPRMMGMRSEFRARCPPGLLGEFPSSMPPRYTERIENVGQEPPPGYILVDEFGNPMECNPMNHSPVEQAPSPLRKFIVFVRGMPLSVSYRDVRRFFNGCDIPRDGLKLINDNKGRRVGTAYIMFGNDASFNRALKLSDTQFERNTINVTHGSWEDYDKAVDSFIPPERPGADEFAITNRKPIMPEKKSQPPIARLEGLPPDVTKNSIQMFFSDCMITQNGGAVFIEKDPSGQCTGKAFVEFIHHDVCKRAISYSQRSMGPFTITVTQGEREGIEEMMAAQERMMEAANNNQSQNGNMETDQMGPGPNSEQGDSSECTPQDDGPREQTYCMHLLNMPSDISGRDLRNIFQDISGEIVRIQISHDAIGIPTGDGYIEVTSQEAFYRGMNKNGIFLGPCRLGVRPIEKAEMIENLRLARNYQVGNRSQQGPPQRRPSPPRGPPQRRPSPSRGPPQRRPSPSRGPPQRRSSPPRRSSPTRPQQYYYVKAGNLPKGTRIGEIMNFFYGYHPIPESVKLDIGDVKDTDSSSTAMIGFREQEEASRAISNINGNIMRNNDVTLTPLF